MLFKNILFVIFFNKKQKIICKKTIIKNNY